MTSGASSKNVEFENTPEKVGIDFEELNESNWNVVCKSPQGEIITIEFDPSS